MHCTHRPGILHFAHGMLDGLRPFFCPRYFCKLYLPRSIRQACSWNNHSSLINPCHRVIKPCHAPASIAGRLLGPANWELGTGFRGTGTGSGSGTVSNPKEQTVNLNGRGRMRSEPCYWLLWVSNAGTGFPEIHRWVRLYTTILVYNIDSRPKGDRAAAGRSPSLFSGFSSNRTSRRSDKNTSRARGLGQGSDPRSNS